MKSDLMNLLKENTINNFYVGSIGCGKSSKIL